MTLRAIDTNVLMRYLTADHREQSPLARALIDTPAEASDQFLVTLPVMCEVTWLLRSRRYGFDRIQIASAWEQLLESSRFRFQARAQVIQAVKDFRAGPADLSDCLILAIAHQEGAKEVMTFDKDFGQLEGVRLVGETVL